MDRHDVGFPDGAEIASHAVAFARMMFAHAEFEREVGSLQDAITNIPGFGEQRDNQWCASESATEKIISLIVKYHGSDSPQIEQIKNLLTDAARLCRQRGFLAHGTWWCFNRRTSTIEIRGGIRWEPDLPPENRSYTASDIEKLADKFKDIERELYRIRRSFEPRVTETEMRAASCFLRRLEARHIRWVERR